MPRIKSLIFIFLFFTKFFVCPAQSTSDTLKLFQSSPEPSKKRINAIAGTSALFFTGSIAALSSAWYKGYDKTSFHFFNDSKEWMQMDKAGHLVSCYHLTDLSKTALVWGGMKKQKAGLYAAAGTWTYLLVIEIMDGYSSKWGFSSSDLLANTAGVGLSLLNDQFDRSWFTLKYSFQNSPYRKYRPEVLGGNFNESLIKDYNGQTYWLNFRLPGDHRLLSNIYLSLGYGAEGMTGGHSNPSFNSKGEPIPSFERYRQYYLSLDLDLHGLVKKPGFLKTFFKTFGFLKIPAPALELSRGEVKFHPVYY